MFSNKQHVAIAPICQAIGLDSYTQGRKIRANPQFSPQLMLAPSSGGMQETLMLPVEEVGMWLCGINALRVKEEVRDILVAFQKHCQVELHAAITGMAGTDRVAALEEQVRAISAQLTQVIEANRKMMQVIDQQQTTINHLTKIATPLAKAEKHIASIGGKFMAAARVTKKMRDDMQ